MNLNEIVSLCIGLLACSVIFVAMVNRLQSGKTRLAQQCQVLRHRAEHLEALCMAIEPLLESLAITAKINGEVISLIQRIQQLAPMANTLNPSLEQALQLASEFAAERRTQAVFRLMSSDAAVAKSKFHLIDTALVIRKLHNLGSIRTDEMEGFVRELGWAHHMVEVITLIGHGQKAAARRDAKTASAYHKKALNSALGSNVQDPRRHSVIKEIKEILNNERDALSLNLMHESGFDLSPAGVRPTKGTPPKPQQAPG